MHIYGYGLALCLFNTKAKPSIKEKNNVYNKKKKIQKYLEQRASDNKCAFDDLLSDYLDGSLKEYLESAKIERIEIHIDWFDDIKCIGIQGCYKKYYMDLQIYPKEFSVSFDSDEPDEDAIYPLESKEQVYNVLSNTAKTL